MSTYENRVAGFLGRQQPIGEYLQGEECIQLDQHSLSEWWNSVLQMPAIPYQVPQAMFTVTSLTPQAAAISVAMTIQIKELNRRIEKLEAVQSGSITAPITILPDDRLEVIRDIPAVLHPVDDSYVATFFDANVNASGDTAQEAFINLQDMICSTYRLYSREQDSLGPELSRDFAMLQKFVGERT